MLGLNHPDAKPFKFVNRYAHLAPSIVAAIEQYVGEVKGGVFPSTKHSYFLPQKTRDELKGGHSLLSRLGIEPNSFFEGIQYDVGPLVIFIIDYFPIWDS